MAISAVVQDGVVQDTSAASNSNSSKLGKSSLDKDAFLQLLVAQMKYQDPLQPTSNTEYIAQLATFSQLEEMQNLTNNMSIQKAVGLVGSNVIMKTVSSATGETYYTAGKVDYVVVENGKAYLAIDEKLFSIDDLDTVVDEEYLKKIGEEEPDDNQIPDEEEPEVPEEPEDSEED